MPMTPLFQHQEQDLAFILEQPRVLNFSDAGTGKTRTSIEAVKARKGEGRTLVLCPKSIMGPAWGEDIAKFAPELSYSLAYAENRAEAFNARTDVVIMNHDGLLWLETLILDKKTPLLDGFCQIIVDECFPADTLISTPSGPQHIKVVKVGDPVYTSLGTALVSNTYTKVTNELVKLHLHDGRSITCTPNHPFATEKGWLPARDIGGMSVVLHDIYQLAASTTLLQPDLLQKSNMGKENPARTRRHQQKDVNEPTRPFYLECWKTLVGRNKGKATSSPSEIRPSTINTWREWKNQPARSVNKRNSSNGLDSPIRNTDKTTQRLGLSDLLQSGLRMARKTMGLRNRWKLAQIAKSAGREKRFLSTTIRVDRVENIQLASPITVYNLETDGVNDYFADGILVHNCTAYKNHCRRSTAINKLKKFFKYRILMTGTPYTNSMTDIWRQALIADDGQHLGNSFYKFRDQICTGRQLGNGITVWDDKPGVEPLVYHLLKDICIRHKLEDCIDIPESTTREVYIELNKQHRKIYEKMEEDAILELSSGNVTAINAAIQASKLLQIVSGAVYNQFGQYTIMDTDRYELIAELAKERPQVLIAFNWKHQKEQLLKLLPEAKVIDGEATSKYRAQLVTEFQAGRIPQLLIHPKSGAHGLTLTAGHATIWASPTYSSEEFTQFNRRIYRAGQTKKTEIILITAKHTIEEKVYAKLQGKLTKAHRIMDLFT